jgi:tetratricopeptide (TPR) repeat protein
VIYRWVVAIAVFSVLMVGSVQAAFITSKHRDDYSRLNFNWESQIEYELKQDGNLVTIKFKRSHPVTKAQLDAQLKSDIMGVRSFTNGKDSLEITFELLKPAHALTLNKGGLVVLDFIFDSKPEDKPKPVEKKEEPKVQPAKDESKKPLDAKDLNFAADADVKQESEAGEKKPIDPTVVIRIEETVEGLKLIFDFQDDCKAGAFIEVGDLWIYFDKSVPFSWDESAMNNSQLLTDIVAYKSNNLSALKIDLLTEPDKASFYKNGHQWILETTDLQGVVPIYVEPRVADQSVTLVEQDFGEPILAQMPETGSARYFIPSSSGPVRLERKYRYIDFYMAPTILGAIVDPLSQGVKVEKKDQNIVISKDTGLALSDPKDIVCSRKRYQQPSLLNFKAWATDAKDTAENKRDYQWDIVSTPKKARTPQRLELVRHYLMTNRFYEALGLLASALTYDPSLEQSPYFHSLQGVAYFAARRYDDARKSFENPVLAGDPEMHVWEQLSKCPTHPLEVKFDVLAGGLQYFDTYPGFLKAPALLLAADAALIQNKDGMVFVSLMKPETLTPRQKEHFEYLTVYNQARAGNPQEVMSVLDDYSKNMQSEFCLKSSLLLTKLKADGKLLEPKDEIDALEQLRHRWSGDQNEYQLWTRLSDRYFETKNYDRSLKFLRKAIRHFPKNATWDNLQQKGKKLFLQVLADKTTDPFDKIALFQEYDIFLPHDEKRFQVQDQLIDLLVKADLVDKAMIMLDQAIKDTASEPEKNIKVRTRYGLLALLNDQPDKALSVLNYQSQEQAPKDLGDQRRYLAAQAFLMQGKHDEMRTLLNNDKTQAAFELVTQSYLDQKDWLNLATYVQTHISEQKKAGNKVEPESVLRLATAYGLLKREDDLNKLRAEHLTLMSGSPYKETFELITAENPTDFSSKGLLKEFSQSKQLTQFLDNYREQVRKQGLSVF